MGARRGNVALVLLIAVSFSACNRSTAVKASEAEKNTASRPALQTQSSRLSAPVQTLAGGATHLVTASSPAPKADTTPPKVVVSDHIQDLTVAQHAFRFVTHLQSIPGTSDETVEWWELRDTTEHVVYRESYLVTFTNGSFDWIVSVNAQAFTTPQGGGILIAGGEEPSAPDDGGWVQVFGYKYGRDKYGADQSLFGPFGPPISVTGEFLGIGTDSYRPTPTSFSGPAANVARDVLKFRLWTGNFNIEYPVQINWITGKVQPAWRCFETTSKGRIERCSYPITAEAHRDSQPTFVRLFPESDDAYTPKHLVVQPQSKVEFLEARIPVSWSEDAKSISFSVDGDVWIKVRIDGVEGWIHSQEDFEAVGLPQSG